MPTTTWGTARQDIARELGFVALATTTNITTNTSIVSTNLADDYDQDSLFIGWFVLIRNDSDGSTSSNNGVVRRITAYTASSGTLTVAGASLSAEDEAVDCELYRFHPDRITDHYNRARYVMYPMIAKVKDIQTGVTGQQMISYTLPTTLRGKPLQVWSREWPITDGLSWNEITDPGFETWTSSTALTNWTLAGTSATVNQESRGTGALNHLVFEGEYSARVLSASSGATTLRQTVTPTVTTEGAAYMFAVWVYCLSSSRVSADAEAAQGSTHGGTGWELLSLGQEFGSSATDIAIGVHCTAGTVISFMVDEAVLMVGQTNLVASRPLPEPGWELEMNWRYLAPVDGESSNGTLEFDDTLLEHRQLRIVGKDLISSVSADTDTFEIETDGTELLYNEIRRQLCLESATTSFAPSNSYWKQLSDEYALKVEMAKSEGRWLHVATPRPKIPDAVGARDVGRKHHSRR